MCYVYTSSPPSFFLLLTILIMVFHKDTLYNFAVDGYNSKLLLLLRGGKGLRLFFYSLYICEHVLFVLQSIFVVVCTFHTHLI